MVKSINDFQGDGMFLTSEDGYVEVIIDDLEYLNNPNKKVKVFLKDGDTFEYIRKIIENRRIMPVHVVKTPREDKAVSSAITALLKLKPNNGCNNEEIIKKIKSTFIKLSVDDDFNYRHIADIIRNKSNDINIDLEAFEKEDFEVTSEYISSVVLNQTVYSLEEYSYIHPKIKLLIGQINKTPLSLEFETE